ncbi:ATP-binding cassette domain-containing protein [bacterium]|nr:ATP-binding cassette domain-containing protein [bacterium]
MSSPEAALEVESLDFTYPDGTPGLRGVGFRVMRGEAVALLGANGSGKSTLLLNLIGVLAGKGTIRVLGTELSQKTLREVRKRTGVLFQDVDSQLFSPRVLDDVAFGPLNLGKTGAEAEAIARTALAQVGLAGYEKRAPHHLSFGEKKRVAIACALALSPDLLLLDGPTAGIDPRSASELLDILAALKESGKTIVATTHDLHFASELCDRVVVIARGAVAAEGDPRELLSRESLLVEHNLVHRHRHRHAARTGRGLPVIGEPDHGHAHSHDHGHSHGHGEHEHPHASEEKPGNAP